MVRLWLAQAEWLLGRLDHWTAPDPRQVQRFVFVCLGNINRSAFAGAVAGRLGMHCASIGLSTTTGAPAWGMAIAQAARQGYDLGSHRATNLADYAYREGDLLLVMEVRHAHRLVAHGIPRHAIAMLGYWASPRRLHLHDPHLLPEPYFATCFTVIESAVRRLGQDFPQAKAAP
jgi:protein-tyrosine phosphatase